MMRKLVIGGATLLLVLIALGVVAFFNLDALLEQNRGRIASLASAAAGRAVAFEKASVAFSNGLAIRIDGLTVAEDPRFGKTDFLALETGYVEVALWPALQRRIEVRGVRLVRPVIQIVQTKRGFNFASLGEGEAAPAAGDAEPGGPPMALVVGALAIEDGTVVYADRTAKDGLALTIEELETAGANLTLDGPLTLGFAGLVRPTAGDASLASRISGEVEIRDRATGEGELRVESPSFAPGLVGVVLSDDGEPERIEDLDVTIGLPANAGKSGYPIALRASEARLAGFDLEALEGTLRYRGSKLEIERFTTGVAGGQAELAGDVAFGAPGQSPFDLDLTVGALDADLLAHVLLGVPKGLVTGKVGGEFDLAGRSLDWETLSRTLAGRIRLEVGDGALEQVNVLDVLASRLVGDPGVGQLLGNSLREAAPEALRGDRTPFDRLLLALDVENGRLRADELSLAAADYGFKLAGELGLDGALDGDGRLRFSPALSEKILKKADRFAPLLADGDVAVLPLRLGGKLSAPLLRPDLSGLGGKAREVASEELKEKAAKKLTDVLFGKKKDKPKDAEATGGAAAGGEPAAPAGADEPAAATDAGGDAAGDAAETDADAQRERDRESTKDLVKDGLDRLLGN